MADYIVSLAPVEERDIEYTASLNGHTVGAWLVATLASHIAAAGAVYAAAYRAKLDTALAGEAAKQADTIHAALDTDIDTNLAVFAKAAKA